jgi:hypothetical protein
LTNLGVDNNVFNSATNPEQDTTANVSPAVALEMKLGPSNMSGNAAGQYTYYSKFDTQRSLGTIDTLRWEVPMARLTPFVSGAYSSTKSRSGYEIDARTRLVTQTVSLGSSIRLAGKTSLVLTGARLRSAFADDEQFDGVNLAAALNHSTNSEQLQLRYQMTTLTTFVAGAEAIQDRFGDGLRSSNSLRILPGFEMKPSALISGMVFVGFRRFEPLNASLPSFQGLVASVDSRFTNGQRQFTVKVNRDLVYSFLETQPYYALTDIQVGVTQRITYNWDIVGRGSWQTLDYQSAAPAKVFTLEDPTPPAARVDRGRLYGGGLGYRIGRVLRIGFDVNYSRRLSTDINNSYEGLRYGASISYGTVQ